MMIHKTLLQKELLGGLEDMLKMSFDLTGEEFLNSRFL